VAPPEELDAGCPAEAGLAVEVNSPVPVSAPLEAALALVAFSVEDEPAGEDVLREKACSGPNSRLALAAGMSAAPEAPLLGAAVLLRALAPATD
jgi:hypothetical protein